MYYSAKTSRHRKNGLSYVPKNILTWMLREVRRGLKATVGNRVTNNHFIHIVFVFFLFLSTRVLFSLEGYAQSMPAHIGHCVPKPSWGLKNIFKFV